MLNMSEITQDVLLSLLQEIVNNEGIKIYAPSTDTYQIVGGVSINDDDKIILLTKGA